ncbi:MAG: hypothetical protein J6V50_04635 [Clostridia bacterium]|nr:hypothetical protein [Clostridia bacterium]
MFMDLKNKFLKTSKIISALIIVSAIVGTMSVPYAFAAEGESGFDYGSFTVDDYADYLEEHKDAAFAKGGAVVSGISCNEDKTDILWDKDSTEAVFIDDANEWGVSYKITLAEGGFYAVRLKYNLGEDILSDAEISLKFNGELPFASADRIKLKGCYVDDGEFSFDSRGNQLRPMQKAVSEWQSVLLSESDGLYDTPYYFYLPEGETTLSVSVNKGAVAIAEIEVCEKAADPVSYEEYKAGIVGETVEDNFIKKIQAENPVKRSDPSLYAVYDRTNLATEPSSAAAIIYNTIGQTNWQYDGQWIEWEFEVPKNGFYEIGFRARQDILSGFSTNRRVYIDGEVPFAELDCVSFPYDRDWRVQMLGDDTPYKIYLEAGKHTIRLENVSGSIGEILRVLETEVYKLQYLYRSMIMITGTDPDPYRDYYLHNDIEGLLPSFEEIAKKLRSEKAKLDTIMGEKGSEGITIEQMATFLESLIEKPSAISKRLSTYNSYVSALSGWVGSGRVQPLELDYIFIKSENEATPKAKANFFSQTFFSLKQILMSFVTDYNTIGDSGEFSKNINIWVGTGREQATAIKEMIMRDFSRDNDIGVNVKLVTSSMLEAILAGKGPEAALFIGGDLPVNLAARNAAVDLSKFEGFDETRGVATCEVPIGRVTNNPGECNVSLYYWTESGWVAETAVVESFVAECSDFDAEALVEGLVGEWELDSMLVYDAEWEKIEQPHRVMGVGYAEGLGYSKLTFNADGTGNKYVEFTEPGVEPETMAFEWQYDADSHVLTLSGDYNAKYVVAGFNGDHIVCDYVYNGDNIRDILKRKAE